MKKTLILGIGNLLMGDEGIGIHVVRRLLKEYRGGDAEIVDGGTGGFHLLEYFFHYERIILVDAALDGKVPGSLSWLEPAFAGDYPRTLVAHDEGFKDVRDAAALLDRKPEIRILTVSVAAVGAPTLELSPAVQAAVGPAVEALLDLIRTLH
ncbi:MAG: hydrogenase maturation protease [Candidatus Aminicenantales bacterium]